MTRDQRRLWWLGVLAIGVLALAASANSIVNGFTYDDVDLIAKNTPIHTLDGWWREFARTYWPARWGGDGYRPLTILAFRLEWALGGGQPLLFHAVNVALHVGVSVAVYWLARGVLPLVAAWIAAALYAVHPVHVEAIANVVGQSELAVALLVSVAAALYVHGRIAGALTKRRWLAIGALYAAACLFKEHAIVLPVLLLLAEATVVVDRAPLRHRLIAMRLPLLALSAVALAYLWARSRVVVGGGAGFAPFAPFQAIEFSATDRVLTMIGVSPEWVRLLMWPARLATEYSPPFVEIAQSVSVSQLPGLLILLGTLGLIVVAWRRSPTTSFGIAWLVVTLLPASNFLVTAGFIIAERTLLLPSVGAMIAIASAVPWLYARFERTPAAPYALGVATAVLLALGIGRSYARNRVWRDNETLLRQGVVDAPDSYRAHYILGTYLFQKAQAPTREGEQHYRRAIELFPYDPYVMYALAEQYRRAGMCARAIPLYRGVIAIAPSDLGRLELSDCLLHTRNLDEARQQALQAISLGAPVGPARRLMAAAAARSDSLARPR